MSQSQVNTNGTNYIFLCKGTLENGRPLISYAVSKNIDDLNILKGIKDQDSFMCLLFKHTVPLEEPVFTLSKNSSLYGFQSPKEESEFLKKLTKKVDRLGKKYTSISSRRFSNGHTIEIQCVKLKGSFWAMPSASIVNSYSHSFEIKNGCYSGEVAYNMKDIDESCKLSADELAVIRAAVQ